MITVYVAVQGAYSDQGVVGVYDSLESAIAAHHSEGAAWRYHDWGSGGGSWEDHRKWHEAISIQPFELEAHTPGADLLERIKALQEVG
ncbi:hypothetical protein LCGC14_2571620 [marine sediment metagenome]|uniref:Uncharacterized protein n=1 Tax=marine sediment metagenome TaxID=412755 RepID=A0A0F9D9Z8_9ZZZZ